MSLPVRSQQEFFQLFIDTLQAKAPDLTDTSEGSKIDSISGAASLAYEELKRLIIDQFKKTFFETANGPEETGGPDDLQTLAVDHFGQAFARPQAVKALDTAIFSRTVDSGDVLIPAGTIVKTGVDANGLAQRYETLVDVTMVDLTVSTDIRAVVAGKAGRAGAGTINILESTLLDTSITVSNAGNATGSDAQDTATYRQTIRNLILALAGATAKAIEAKAKTVAGIATASAVEHVKTVIEYDVATSSTVGSPFRLPVPYLYVGDENGTASSALLAQVLAAINSVKALGVIIHVLSATGVEVDWTAAITLNPSGPNYATFVSNPSRIVDSMTDYINNLPVGTSFVRATARTAILAIWGPSGTNDLTVFSTSVPFGDVSATASQKLRAGTVGLA